MALNPRTEILIKIRDLIHSSFDPEELRDLCFELDINYADLSGQNHRARVRELVRLLDRQDRLSDLLAVCQVKRKKVIWPTLPQNKPADSKTRTSSLSWRWVVGTLSVTLLLITLFKYVLTPELNSEKIGDVRSTLTVSEPTFSATSVSTNVHTSAHTPQSTIPNFEPTAIPNIFSTLESGVITSTNLLDVYTVPNTGHLTNFTLSIDFESPYDATNEDIWDFGVAFRLDGALSRGYYLIFDSTGGWTLSSKDESSEHITIHSDNFSKGLSINPLKGDINTLTLSVFDEDVCFVVNSGDIKSFQFEESPAPGRIDIVAGYWLGNVPNGQSVTFSNLIIRANTEADCT